MVNINWASVNRRDPEMWVADKDRFYAFPSTESDQRNEQNLALFILRGMNEALQFIQSKVLVHRPCNECFKRLPKRRSFADIWNDKDTWIHYNGRSRSFGFHRPGTKEIAICYNAFIPVIIGSGIPNSMQVAATIVHELAHVGGAEGDASKRDNSAENTLKFCLLTSMFKPDVFGVIEKQTYENSTDTRYIA